MRRYRGVSWHRGHGRWRAKLKTHGKHVHLGDYLTAEDAARAWDCGANMIRGTMARLNFPADAGRPPTCVTQAAILQRLMDAGVVE